MEKNEQEFLPTTSKTAVNCTLTYKKRKKTFAAYFHFKFKCILYVCIPTIALELFLNMIMLINYPFISKSIMGGC